ncbi:RutC family protein in vnfA 5'region [Varanus komodoensis]|nr:RutC family protein in vnfA 5'region [Varanus komodoensis]
MTPVLRQLHWLPIEARAQFKVLIMTYKALNGLGPGDLNERLCPYMPDRPLRSAGESLLWEPSVEEIRRVGDILYCAGQIALVPCTMQLISGGVETEALISLRHVEKVLKAMHAELQHVLMANCYVTDSKYISVAQAVWKTKLRELKREPIVCVYMKPLGEVIRRCGLRNHQYTDDTQLYLSFSTNPGEAMAVLNWCLAKVMGWMSANKLKLNSDKMEVLLVGGSGFREGELNLVLNGVALPLRDEVHSLGVLLDPELSLEAQMTAVARSAFFQLRLIHQLRPYLENDCLVTVTHTLVTSRLDFCNALYVGLPLKIVWIFQLVQNRAARLLMGTGRYGHMTPVLRQLHWLPIEVRAQCKVLVMTYKALNSLGPGYLKERLRPYMPTRPLRSVGEALLREPSVKEIRRAEDEDMSNAVPAACGELAVIVVPFLPRAASIEWHVIAVLDEQQQKQKFVLMRSLENCQIKCEAVQSHPTRTTAVNISVTITSPSTSAISLDTVLCNMVEMFKQTVEKMSGDGDITPLAFRTFYQKNSFEIEALKTASTNDALD